MAIGWDKLRGITRQLSKAPEQARLNLIQSLLQTLFGKTQKKTMMRLGMFKGPCMSTEKDFKIAEWNPDKEQENG